MFWLACQKFEVINGFGTFEKFNDTVFENLKLFLKIFNSCHKIENPSKNFEKPWNVLRAFGVLRILGKFLNLRLAFPIYRLCFQNISTALHLHFPSLFANRKTCNMGQLKERKNLHLIKIVQNFCLSPCFVCEKIF